MKDGPFVRPGGAQEIKTSAKSPDKNAFARPGGATDIPSGRGPNQFPEDLAGTPEMLKGN